MQGASATPLKLLIVDDDPVDRQIYRRMLDETGRAYRLAEASTGEEAARLLHAESPDCVLLDQSLPGQSGTELLADLRGPDEPVPTPVVMLTGDDRVRTVVEAMQAGADEYVLKGQVSPQALSGAIASAVEKHRLRQKIRMQQAALSDALRHELEIKDEFISHVSHELRTPLAAIHQFLSLLEDGTTGPLSEEQSEFVRIAYHNAQQLKQMIDDLMGVSRARSGKLRVDRRVMELRNLVSESLRAARSRAANRNVEAAVRIEEDLPRVLGDPIRVRQVLGNLLANAFDFTPEGGAVTVTARLDPESPGLVRTTVSDTGCGIPPEDRDRIFERLRQSRARGRRSRSGLGVGLFLCRELVTRMGGRIWVESEVDRGSAFHFTLPVYSLPELLRPALLADGRVRPHYGVVRVDLEHGDGDSDGVPERVRRRAHYALGRMLGARDEVLLPRPAEPPADEALFAVVVGVSAGRLPTLVRRALRCFEKAAAEGLAVSARVSVRPESLDEAVRREDAEARLEAVARRVEALQRAPADSPEWTPEKESA